MNDQQPLVEIQNLKVYFPIMSKGFFGKVQAHVRAVDDVSFTIYWGETLGLVGESGSGKTTLGRTILRVVPPSGGQIRFHTNEQAVDLNRLPPKELRAFRHHMQMIFQDPYASLNPRMTVRDIIAEPLEANRLARGKAVDERVRETAARCRLNLEHLHRFPHAFSGGQRQRIGIARALVSQPEFIVCDEAVSSLDVSIQADILNLLSDLQDEFGLTYLFIAHDLSVVAHISDRVAVMYLGQVIELAPTRQLFSRPLHPYTEALIAAIPDVSPEPTLNAAQLQGEIPNPADPPSGCRFHTRCPYVQERCRQEEPALSEIEPEHFVKCHYATDLQLTGV